jgi:2-hydroxymuconate-semialdehyde hydrolase
MTKIQNRRVDVGGIGTHYLEAGSGSDMILLHSGEFGANAELTWERMLPQLAERHHVIAPDWLGYGETDKLYDFTGGGPRRVKHMTAFLEVIGIESAVFVGNSMGGSALARVAATTQPVWPLNAVVLLSGGGFPPHNDDRQTLLDYDGTPEAMRKMMTVLFHDPGWALRDEYIDRRVELSKKPGAWECVAAARFRSPMAPVVSEFGRPDATPYELISAPTLIIAGENDKLREPGYANELGERIPDARLLVYQGCGHMPNLELPEQTAADVLAFVAELEAGGSVGVDAHDARAVGANATRRTI